MKYIAKLDQEAIITAIWRLLRLEGFEAKEVNFTWTNGIVGAEVEVEKVKTTSGSTDR